MTNRISGYYERPENADQPILSLDEFMYREMDEVLQNVLDRAEGEEEEAAAHASAEAFRERIDNGSEYRVNKFTGDQDTKVSEGELYGVIESAIDAAQATLLKLALTADPGAGAILLSQVAPVLEGLRRFSAVTLWRMAEMPFSVTGDGLTYAYIAMFNPEREAQSFDRAFFSTSCKGISVPVLASAFVFMINAGVLVRVGQTMPDGFEERN